MDVHVETNCPCCDTLTFGHPPVMLRKTTSLDSLPVNSKQRSITLPAFTTTNQHFAQYCSLSKCNWRNSFPPNYNELVAFNNSLSHGLKPELSSSTLRAGKCVRDCTAIKYTATCRAHSCHGDGIYRTCITTPFPRKPCILSPAGVYLTRQRSSSWSEPSRRQRDLRGYRCAMVGMGAWICCGNGDRLASDASAQNACFSRTNKSHGAVKQVDLVSSCRERPKRGNHSSNPPRCNPKTAMGIPSLFCCNGVHYKCNADGLLPSVPLDFTSRKSRQNSAPLSDCDSSFSSLPECDTHSVLTECDHDADDRTSRSVCHRHECIQKDDNGNILLANLNKLVMSPDAMSRDKVILHTSNEDLKQLLQETHSVINGKHTHEITHKEYLKDLFRLSDIYARHSENCVAYPVIFGRLKNSLNAMLPRGGDKDESPEVDRVHEEATSHSHDSNANYDDPSDMRFHKGSLSEAKQSDVKEMTHTQSDDPFLFLHSSMMQSLVTSSHTKTDESLRGMGDNSEENESSSQNNDTPSVIVVESVEDQPPMVPEEAIGDDLIHLGDGMVQISNDAERESILDSSMDSENVEFFCPLTGEPILKSVRFQNNTIAEGHIDGLKTSPGVCTKTDPSCHTTQNSESHNDSQGELADHRRSPDLIENDSSEPYGSSTGACPGEYDGLKLSLQLIDTFADIDIEAIEQKLLNSSDPLLEKLDALQNLSLFPNPTDSENNMLDEEYDDGFLTPLCKNSRTDSTSTLTSTASTPALSPMNHELLEKMNSQIDLIEMYLTSPHVFSGEYGQWNKESRAQGRDPDANTSDNAFEHEDIKNSARSECCQESKDDRMQQSGKKITKKTVTFAPNLEILNDGIIISNAIKLPSLAPEEIDAPESPLRKYSTVDQLDSLRQIPKEKGLQRDLLSFSDDEDGVDTTVICVQADIHTVDDTSGCWADTAAPSVGEDATIHDSQRAAETGALNADMAQGSPMIDKWEKLTVLDKEISNCIIRQRDDLEDLRWLVAKTEEQQRDMYLQMFQKGQASARFAMSNEVAQNDARGSSNQLKKTLWDLQESEGHLAKLQQSPQDADEGAFGVDSDLILACAKDAFFHYIVDRRNKNKNLRILLGLLNFNAETIDFFVK